MALQLTDCTFAGPAFPEPFVKFQLEEKLRRLGLLPRTTGPEGAALQESWDVYRRHLRDLGSVGGAVRVSNHVLEPLAPPLGYARIERTETVATREGEEEGGQLFLSADGAARLRVWSLPVGTDLDAPGRRGRAYRFSPSRIAQRVLQARGERVGLLTDGDELRLLFCDPARPDSHLAISLDRFGGWRGARSVPDSFRLLVALTSPAGAAKVPELVEDARLAQTTVTAKLRQQARRAVETFVQGVLDHPANEHHRAGWAADPAATARLFWSEGLVLVYRLLFVLKLESEADPARAFSFAATALWRKTYSPSTALAPIVRRVVDRGADTGQFLEESLRALFRLFERGLTSSELRVTPLGGMLFGRDATPLLDALAWGEGAVASLLDHLLWTAGDGRTERERVHYGTLDVEDLGRVYESLLELEPGISTEPMCRLKRAKLEVVLPLARGERYRTAEIRDENGDDDEEGSEAEDDDEPRRGAKTRVKWIEQIPAGRFFLRVGLGRKASGSYYTPHAFVRFLVLETLGPQVAERSPPGDPRPAAILGLKVLDPAMGSGHFLVEACRYLADKLYEACRLCDERALEAEERAERAGGEEQEQLRVRAAELRERVEALPDPNNDLIAYLPSRVSEGAESGLSQRRAEALCRRLVAVHCLYGVDKNPLAVGLAKVSLWLESYAEGLPLTFLDHRLVLGDSLTGPFVEHLLTWPRAGGSISTGSELYLPGIRRELEGALGEALGHVRELEQSVGVDLGDLESKRAAKERLDRALGPFRVLAAAWSGGVMLGEKADDVAYANLLKAAIEGGASGKGEQAEALLAMLAVGRAGLSYDLAFPEVFHPSGTMERDGGFDAVLGNPPWDVPGIGQLEFLSSIAVEVERRQGAATDVAIENLMRVPAISAQYGRMVEAQRMSTRAIAVIAQGGEPLNEVSAAFLARMTALSGGGIGLVMPSSIRRNKTQAWLRKRLVCDGRIRLIKVVGFVNSRRLFSDLPPVIQYDLLVLGRSSTRAVQCAFQVTTTDVLFCGQLPVEYSHEAIRGLNPDQYTLAEVDSTLTVHVLESVFSRAPIRIATVMDSWHVGLSQEINQRSFARYCTRLPNDCSDPREPGALRRLNDQRLVPLLESKSIYQFTANWEGLEGSGWDPVPHHAFSLDQSVDIARSKAATVSRVARYFRLAYRETCGSPHTNERSVVGCIIPPGMTAFHSAMVERSPERVENCNRLAFLGVTSTLALDAIARLQIGQHLSVFILRGLPFPSLELQARVLIAHSALRLSCNSDLYASLFVDQVGEEWREAGEYQTWPVLSGEARWTTRSVSDALVAHAYGLDRAQYEHVLASFSHSSYPDAPRLCLAAFDELQRDGLEGFCRRHDPYWDIPLPTGLPKPVLDFPSLRDSDLGPVVRERGGQTSFMPADFGPLYAKADESGATPAPVSRSSARTRASFTEAAEPFERITALLSEREVITSRDAQEATGLDASGVRPHLRRLVDEGLATTEGERRGMRYRRAAR